MTEPLDNPPADATDMVALLTRQRDLYRLLLDLTGKQHAAIESHDTDALLQVLTTRGRVMTQIASTQERVGEMQAHPAAGPVDDGTRTRARELVDEVAGLLETIIQKDDEDRARLREGRDSIRRRLGQVRHAGAAAQRYGHAASSHVPPRPALAKSLQAPSLTDFKG